MYATGCPGYATAFQRIENVQKGREWMAKIDNQNYNILQVRASLVNHCVAQLVQLPSACFSLQMTFSMTPQGQFTNVKATVELFGKQFSIQAGDINPYLPDVAGPAVANAALEMFKNSV